MKFIDQAIAGPEPTDKPILYDYRAREAYRLELGPTKNGLSHELTLGLQVPIRGGKSIHIEIRESGTLYIHLGTDDTWEDFITFNIPEEIAMRKLAR